MFVFFDPEKSSFDLNIEKKKMSIKEKKIFKMK